MAASMVPLGHWMSRAEVEEMHRLAAEGLRPTEIEARTGRSRKTVYRALRRDPADVPEVPSVPTPPNEMSRRVRRVRTEMRAELASGALALRDVLQPVHPDLATMTLADVAMLQWRTPARAYLDRLGREAVRADVNLLRCAGQASVRSRAWLVEHGSRFPVADGEREAA